MQTTTTIGLDIAKSVFQVHGIDRDGNVVVRRQLKRRYVLTFFAKLPPCHWHRGMRVITLLVARAPGARSHRTADATSLRRLPRSPRCRQLSGKISQTMVAGAHRSRRE